MIRNVLTAEIFEDLNWLVYPGTNARMKITYLAHHTTDDNSLIYIKLWFEHLCLVEEDK